MNNFICTFIPTLLNPTLYYGEGKMPPLYSDNIDEIIHFSIVLILTFFLFLGPAIRSFQHARKTGKRFFIITGLIPIFNIYYLVRENAAPKWMTAIYSIIYGTMVTGIILAFFFDFNKVYKILAKTHYDFFIIPVIFFSGLIFITYIFILVDCVFYGIERKKIKPAIIGVFPGFNILYNSGKDRLKEKFIFIATLVQGITLLFIILIELLTYLLKLPFDLFPFFMVDLYWLTFPRFCIFCVLIYPAVISIQHALKTGIFEFVITGLIPVLNIYVLQREKGAALWIISLYSIVYGILISYLMYFLLFNQSILFARPFNRLTHDSIISLMIIAFLILITYVFVAVNCLIHAIRKKEIKYAIIGILPVMNIIINARKSVIIEKQLFIPALAKGITFLTFFIMLFDFLHL
ncbi:hypothetical protein J7L05_03285 [bacterium]|nr:hypothetical protein [bacterium]